MQKVHAMGYAEGLTKFMQEVERPRLKVNSGGELEV